MPSTKTLNQSPTISAVENADLLWVWDSSASELNKISRTNLLTTTDDFNTSYARLAGRSGGQTLIGGTAANDDLTLEGTSNATRTTSYVILQPTAGNVGIGTVSPGVKLDVNGLVAADRYILNSAPTNSFQGSLSAIGSDLTYNILAGPTNGPIIRARWSSGTADRYLEFGQADNAGIYTPHFRILNGNVGIGTTNPSRKLHVVGTILIDGDEGGIAGTIGLTDGFDLATRSTGVGTIKFNDATSRDSSGFVKIYIGVTEYYIPVFAAI